MDPLHSFTIKMTKRSPISAYIIDQVAVLLRRSSVEAICIYKWNSICCNFIKWWLFDAMCCLQLFLMDMLVLLLLTF